MPHMKYLLHNGRRFFRRNRIAFAVDVLANAKTSDSGGVIVRRSPSLEADKTVGQGQILPTTGVVLANVFTGSELALEGRENPMHQQRDVDPRGLWWPQIYRTAQLLRLCGVFPLSNLNPDIDVGHKFRWTSWTSVYSVVLLTYCIFAKTFMFYKLMHSRWLSGPDLDVYFQMTRFFFLQLVTLVQDVLLFARMRHVPRLVRGFVDQASQLQGLGVLAESIVFVTAAFTFASHGVILFHFLFDGGGDCVLPGCHYADGGLNVIVYVMCYLGGGLFCFNSYVPIMWICVLSRALVLAFRRVGQSLHQQLEEAAITSKNNMEEILEEERLKYGRLCSLVAEVDDVFSPLTFTTCCVLFTSVCANTYTFIFYASSEGSITPAITLSLTFAVMSSIGLMAMVVFAGGVKDEASKTIRVLQHTKVSNLSKEAKYQLHLFVSTASIQPPPCLSAWGFFPLTREAATTVIGVVVTYIVVLLQFRLGIENSKSNVIAF